MMEVKTSMVKDPVCGMNVDERTTNFKSEYLGKTYHFCNQSCKAMFEKSPKRFTDGPPEHEGHGCCCC
jgi:YHS domain-containing protein